MAAWVVCALCALIVIKPQEFVPALDGLPLVYIAFGVALVSVALDIVFRRLRPALAPQVPFVLAFFAWALLTTGVKRPGALGEQAMAFAILLGIFGAIALGLASASGLRAFGVMFAGCGALITAVAIVQNESPYGCFIGAEDDWGGRGALIHDGRPCESALDCRKDAPVPNGNYRCERVGPLGTSSIEGRVRYRGSLADPNELSLMIAAAIPFILLARRSPPPRGGAVDAEPASARTSRPSTPTLPPLLSDRLLGRISGAIRALPRVSVIAAIGFTVILARSRTGLIVFLLVLGITFVRKVGPVGLVIGCFVAPPMLLFGGRSGAEADQSFDERAELLGEAFEFLRRTRGIGLGAGQFTDESSLGLTAHNAYLLAAAETGIVGFVLFGFAVYLSLKVPYAIWFGRYRLRRATARFASALAIALSGAAVGVFFLSWTYKDILFMLLGASAALYAAARAEDRRVDIGLSLREAALVTALLFGMLAAIYVAFRLRR